MKEPTSTQHELAFSDLSPDDFERLVHFILEDSEEFFDVTRYGGVRDRGRDIVAIKQGGNKKEKWYFQCKRYKEISSVDLIPELEKISSHSLENPEFKPDGIVFAISCTITDQEREKVNEKARRLGMVKPDIWTKHDLDVKVRNNPTALEVFYGISYTKLSLIFNEQIRRELKRVKPKFIPGLYTKRERAEVVLSILSEPLEFLKQEIRKFGENENIEFNHLVNHCLEIIKEQRVMDRTDMEKILNLISKEIQKTKGVFDSQNDGFWKNRTIVLENYVQDIMNLLMKQVFLIIDPAGTGKTNLLCNWAESSKVEDSKYNFILLTGNLSIHNESGIGRYLLDSLSHSGVVITSLPTLLKSLQFLTREQDKPIIIAIDAINENRDIISTDESLKQFLDDVSNYPEIKIVISCRSDYFKRFTFHENRDNLRIIEGLLRGFSSEELQKAIPHYLDYYQIDADFSDTALDSLLMPLVLRMFCEAYGNTDSNNVKHLGYFQDILLHRIFVEFERRKFNELKRKDQTLFRTSRVFQNCLLDIAKLMLDNRVSQVSLQKLLDNLGFSEDDDSIYVKLLNEEIFVEESFSDAVTMVGFSLDSYREYRFAGYLHSLYEKSECEFKSYMNTLILEDTWVLSEGLLRFLFIELRQKSGTNLWALFNYPKIVIGSIEGLAQLEIDEIQKTDITFIQSMIKDESDRIFNLMFRRPRSADWKIGLKLLDLTLSKMSMTERDIMFGSFLCRNPSYVYNRIIPTLHELVNGKHIEKDMEKIEPSLKVAIWLLGSNVTGLRYAANITLLELGLKNPEWVVSILKKYWTIYDYYIRERIMSLIFAISRSYPKVAISCANQVKTLFLDRRSKHYSTHFVIREFAKEVILLAYEVDSTLFSKSQIEKIKKINRPSKIVQRIRGIRPTDQWTGFSDYPILMDMKIYNFGHMAHYFNKHRCDATDIAIDIISKLGYTEVEFEDLDIEIRDRLRMWEVPAFEDTPTKIERFGKKYAWQAYRILQGLWIDTLDFVSQFNDDFLLFSDREFDPLFPVTKITPFSLEIDLLRKMPIEKWIKKKPELIKDLVFRKEGFIVIGGDIVQREEPDQRVSIGIVSFIVESSVTQLDIDNLQKKYGVYGHIHSNQYMHEIITSQVELDDVEELFVFSGNSEFILGNNNRMYSVRADFVESLGLSQVPRTLNFIDEKDNEIIKTQYWERPPEDQSNENHERRENGDCIMVRLDFLKRYLRKKKKILVISMIVDRWGVYPNREISWQSVKIE